MIFFNLGSADFIVFLRCSEVFHSEFIVSSVIKMCLALGSSKLCPSTHQYCFYLLEQMNAVQLVAEEGFWLCCKT